MLLLCECPDYASVAALGLAASASGVVRTKTTPLLTVEELDQTIARGVNYRPPGQIDPRPVYFCSGEV